MLIKRRTKLANIILDPNRHTDNTLERRNLSEKLKEFTTQKIRQEWAEHEELFQGEKKPADSDSLDNQSKASNEAETEKAIPAVIEDTEKEKDQIKPDVNLTPVTTSEATKEVSKSKTKKRRKKSQMKKNAQRKNSSSSSLGSAGGGDLPSAETPSLGVSNIDEGDAPISSATNNNNTSSSNDEQLSAPLVTARTGDDSPLSEIPHTPTSNPRLDLDIHFFSDTEITTPVGGGGAGSGRAAGGRPSTPIQSDSELETTMRDNRHVVTEESTASWKWGELPTPEQAKNEAMSAAQVQQSEHQSMLSNMFSFMKRANRLRKEKGVGEVGDIYLSDLDAGSMDPEMAALYFPSPLSKAASPPEEDGESGNGTSLPHSPSSLEEGQKSIDSDFDETKQQRDNK